ncbi:metallophosphoesterase family protein [Desulfatirhabdium butyrativorans]|uniref:metallophosphoesterase family protein n=1 Tax=Desulfatirhabdium butyrativorans TaxID=340467 RepID=UPI0004229872|nr:metallophosphoesterase family protein [Desulfatirhabdium butyrativorans]
MKTCFFGDIHGNIWALEAVLRHAEARHADRLICLGDWVGWLPFGDRTYERMIRLAIPSVAGNHDLMVAGVFPDLAHQTDRMQASAYNAALLCCRYPSNEALTTLSQLPLTLDYPGMSVVHHSPFSLPREGEPPAITHFPYLDEKTLGESLEAWSRYPVALIVSGHDHIPAVFELRADAGEPSPIQRLRIHKPENEPVFTLKMEETSRYWVKAGSVGGPYRDGVFAANSFILDDARATLSLHRIPYDSTELKRSLSENRYFRNIRALDGYRR